jgi:hypothetical protein
VTQGIALLPPSSSDHPAISASQAIALAMKQGQSSGARLDAVLARATDPSTFPPPDAVGKWSPINNELVWIVVITFTHPAKMNFGAHPTPTGVASATSIVDHMNLMFDATSGAFRRGWFTR